jgi:hypothetical protein
MTFQQSQWNSNTRFAPQLFQEGLSLVISIRNESKSSFFVDLDVFSGYEIKG